MALALGRPNISLLFETHPGLLLETLERARSSGGSRLFWVGGHWGGSPGFWGGGCDLCLYEFIIISGFIINKVITPNNVLLISL